MKEENNTLKEELEYYESIKTELLKNYLGQYALIKGKKLEGTFTTSEQAYAVGVAKFSNQPFLIKKIIEKEEIQHIPALIIHLQ